MTRLTWNNMGERLFETGVDKGVLFIGNMGYAWHGLIGVNEAPEGGTLTSYHLDGLKYHDQPATQEFSATIEAYTYPEEFAQCEGVEEVANGLFASNQNKASFGLSYRTLIGNDLEGEDYGYKIHLIYNAKAEPSARANQSIDDQLTPFTFSWLIKTRPPRYSGVVPTSHFVIDSRQTPDQVLDQIEDILYGTDITNPRLPTLEELFFIFNNYQTSVIDAGFLGETYFTTFDAGVVGDAITDTIDGGSP